MMLLSRTPRRKHAFLHQCLRVYGLRPSSAIASSSIDLPGSYTQEKFARLTRFWVPQANKNRDPDEDAQSKLIRAGFFRQSQPGIFHMLPLGLRVQEKVEKLIEKHMSQLGASKLALSSLTSESLWEKTDRLKGYGKELFHLKDRRDSPFLLAPTHEEEITALIASRTLSYKTLPLKVYQIGRKYRDELRPRQGVLRAREFIMKDLYTFDYSVDKALITYEQVRATYSRCFDELKLSYLVAEASSGDIGGDLSHEYHLPSPIGEDTVFSCSSCDYIANEEVASQTLDPEEETITDHAPTSIQSVNVWRAVSKDRSAMINVWYPNSFSREDIDTYAIKSILPAIDLSVEDSVPYDFFRKPEQAIQPNQSTRLVNIVDYRLGTPFADALRATEDRHPLLPKDSDLDLTTVDSEYINKSENGSLLNLIRVHDGDRCPRCKSGTLKSQKSIELGHTFHLGTRYSAPLEALVRIPLALYDGTEAEGSTADSATVFAQMGCHGIGVSRIIGAVANHLVDKRGLNWPRVITPFDVVVIPGKEHEDGEMIASYLTRSQSSHPLDLIFDDREGTRGFKLQDADLVGYPVIVVLGDKWTSERKCEVQCRRLHHSSFVSFEELPAHIDQLLYQL
ncbi:prolyl-tRNA synthetase [Jackrogersella minutella]|nr:prolyl-tRNA synthetase [Jackrogersella minutella]